MTSKIPRSLAMALLATSCSLDSGCFKGSCPIERSELISMEPWSACLDVRGNTPTNSQCVFAAMDITNNCADALVFPLGSRANGGKLTFAPGESGRYDSDPSMQIEPQHWVVAGTLGAQSIVFTIQTYSP